MGRTAPRHSVTREERHNARLAAVVAASDDAIISLGTDFVVQTWNAGAQRMFGYGEAEARGHRLTELIIPDVDKDESASILAAVLNGHRHWRTGSHVPYESLVRRRYAAVTVADRCAQEVVRRYLEPILEAVFHRLCFIARAAPYSASDVSKRWL